MKIGKYEFELRAFNYLDSRSDETYCFGATLYVNRKKFAECGNGGQGGATDVDILPECKTFGEEVVAFLKTQPPIKAADSDFEFDCDLEYIVNELVEKEVNKRELKKAMRWAKTMLVFQKPDGDFLQYRWKISLPEILKTASGPSVVREIIADQVGKGCVLLNENIPANLLCETK